MDDCPICIEQLDDHEHGTKVPLPCGHLFHYECLIKWHKSICPVCRIPYAWMSPTHPVETHESDTTGSTNIIGAN